MYFGFSLGRMNYIVSLPACVSHPCDRRSSSLHIEFVQTGSSIYTRYMYPQNNSVLLQWMWLAVGSTVIEFFERSMRT